MPLRDSWHRALVFSGLVDDRPQPFPDHLLSAESEPAAPAAAPAVPPLVGSGPPAWQTTGPTATEDPTNDYRVDDVEQIVVRRLPAQLPPLPPPSSAPPSSAPPSPAPAAGDQIDEIEEIFAGDEVTDAPVAAPRSVGAAPRAAPSPPPAAASRPPAAPGQEVSVLRVAPRSFNDAQVVADRFKASGPVILDMKGVETDLAKRLIGFASGLTYGLDGGMERLDDRVFLLTPRGVTLPAAQRSRLAAQGSLHRV